MSVSLRRLVASFAMLVFAGTLALPLGTRKHLSWNDDSDCALLTADAGHLPTAVKAAPDSPAAGHCALCHWQRTFAGASLVPVQWSGLVLDPHGLAAAGVMGWYGRLASLDRPSRAPPASL